MCTLDIILLLCFAPALLQGLRKGLLQQVSGVVSIILGTFLAFKFSSELSEWLCTMYPEVNPKLMAILCFAGVVIITIIVIWLLCNLFLRLLCDVTLGWINRVLGLLFSIFKAALILGILLTLMDSLNGIFSFIKQSTLDESVMYTAIHEFSNWIFPFFKELISNA